MSIRARVSKEIMLAREAKRVNKITAAERCGISAREYLDLENGHSLPSLPTALRMAAALGVSWDALAQELFGEKRLVYAVFEEHLASEGGEAYCGYGLECLDNGAVVGRLADISCDKEFVQRLARLFTARQLPPPDFLLAVQVMLEFSLLLKA